MASNENHLAWKCLRKCAAILRVCKAFVDRKGRFQEENIPSPPMASELMFVDQIKAVRSGSSATCDSGHVRRRNRQTDWHSQNGTETSYYDKARRVSNSATIWQKFQYSQTRSLTEIRFVKSKQPRASALPICRRHHKCRRSYLDITKEGSRNQSEVSSAAKTPRKNNRAIPQPSAGRRSWSSSMDDSDGMTLSSQTLLGIKVVIPHARLDKK